MAYDYLIVATGSTHSYFGHEEWAELAPGLKTMEDATEIRRRVLLAFELAERQMLETGAHPPLNFVVIGGGPTGVELAGAISDIAKLYMTKDFRHIDPKTARGADPRRGRRISWRLYPEDLQQKAVEQLNALGVEVRSECARDGYAAGLRDGGRASGSRRGDAVGGGCAGFAAGQAAGRGAGQAGLRAGG